MAVSTTEVKGLLQISVGNLPQPCAYFVFESKEAAEAADRGVIAAVQATDALVHECWDTYIPSQKAEKCPDLPVFRLKLAHPSPHVRAYVARQINLVKNQIKDPEDLIRRIEKAMKETALAAVPRPVERTKGDPTLLQFDFRNPAHFQGKLPPLLDTLLPLN